MNNTFTKDRVLDLSSIISLLIGMAMSTAVAYSLSQIWSMAVEEIDVVTQTIKDEIDDDDDNDPPPSASAFVIPPDLHWLKWRNVVYHDY